MAESSGFFVRHHNKVLANQVFCSSTPATLGITEIKPDLHHKKKKRSGSAQPRPKAKETLISFFINVLDSYTQPKPNKLFIRFLKN